MTIEKAILVDEAEALALEAGATWLLQKRRWNYRGPVGIVVRGSGAVSAVAEMADCLDPVADAAAMAKGAHGLDAKAQAAALEAGATVPWVLSEVRMLKRPVGFEQGRAPGPNINLDAETGAKVARAADGAAAATAANSASRRAAPAPAASAKTAPAPAASARAAPSPAAAARAKPAAAKDTASTPAAAAPKPQAKAAAPEPQAQARKSWIRRIFIGD